jgi:rubrerythrin
MLQARDLYQLELSRCRATLDLIKWHSAIVAAERLQCVDCDSTLIEQSNPKNEDQEQMALVCQACGAEPTVADAIVAAVDRALSGEGYIRAKDSGESGPIYDCPECMNASYIDTEARCAVCGHEFRWEDCARCYASIPLEDASMA